MSTHFLPLHNAFSPRIADFAAKHWKTLLDAAERAAPACDGGGRGASLSLSLPPVSGDDALDAMLHRSLRNTFSKLALDVGSFTRNTIHNSFTLPKWRALLLGWEGRIDNFNMMSLLRVDCCESYDEARARDSPIESLADASADGDPDGDGTFERLMLVPRVQFLMIEATRQREGCYDALPRRLRSTALARASAVLARAAAAADADDAKAKIGAMKAAHSALDSLERTSPPPSEDELRNTRVGKRLAAIARGKSDFGDASAPAGTVAARATALGVRWRAVIELRRAVELGNGAREKLSQTTLELVLSRLERGGDDDSETDDAVARRAPTTPAPAAFAFDPSRRAAAARALRAFGVITLVSGDKTEGAVLPRAKAAALASALETRSLVPTLERISRLGLHLGDAIEFSDTMNREGGRLDVSYRVGATLRDLGLERTVLESPAVRAAARAALGGGAAGGEPPEKLIRVGVVWSYGSAVAPYGCAAAAAAPRDAAASSPGPQHQCWHRDSGSLFEDDTCAAANGAADDGDECDGVAARRKARGARSALGALPCHCINVFVPLIDVKSDGIGPTELWPGTHDDAAAERASRRLLVGDASGAATAAHAALDSDTPAACEKDVVVPLARAGDAVRMGASSLPHARPTFARPDAWPLPRRSCSTTARCIAAGATRRARCDPYCISRLLGGGIASARFTPPRCSTTTMRPPSPRDIGACAAPTARSQARPRHRRAPRCPKPRAAQMNGASRARTRSRSRAACGGSRWPRPARRPPTRALTVAATRTTTAIRTTPTASTSCSSRP